MPFRSLKRKCKTLIKQSLSASRLFVNRSVNAEELLGRGVHAIHIVEPAADLTICPSNDPFLSVAKYHTEGICHRPPVYVAEMHDAPMNVATGLVCTNDFRALADRGMHHRMSGHRGFGYMARKPSHVRHLPGTYATINTSLAGNYHHWVVDCLAKVLTLERALAPGERVTLLMPNTANPMQRESLRSVLPPSMDIEFFPADSWVRPDRLYWPSLAATRCCPILPDGYYATIRQRVFGQLAITNFTPRLRLYISRSLAKIRRVRNEAALCHLLAQFGFQTIRTDQMSFREQVELFSQAECICGPNGAGLTNLAFSNARSLFVFYPSRLPANFFHAMAQVFGMRHLFVCHGTPRFSAEEMAETRALILANEDVPERLLDMQSALITDEDRDFDVNLDATERVLKGEFGDSLPTPPETESKN